MPKDPQQNPPMRDIWRLLLRGYGTLRRILPGYLPLSAAAALIDAAKPLITLFFSARILDALGGTQDLQEILTYVLLNIGIAFVLSVARAAMARRLEVIADLSYRHMYFDMDEHFMRFAFEQVERTETSELLADIRAKMSGNGLGLPRLYWQFPLAVQNAIGVVASALLLIGMFTTAAVYTPSFITTPYATLVLAVLIVLSMLPPVAMRKREKAVLQSIFDHNPKVNTYFNHYMQYVEAQNAAKDIRLYNQSPTILHITAQWLNMNVWHRFFDFEGKKFGLSAAMNAFAGGCIYLLIGLRAAAGMYSIGSVVQYVGAVRSLVQNASQLLGRLEILRLNHPFLQRYFEFCDLPTGMREGGLTTEKRDDGRYQIAFENVSFRYPGATEWALENLTLTLRVGERLAVVGMNGSGKTTMIKLLCRLYDPTEGRITLNGIDIRKYDTRQVQDLLSVVFQDFTLFSLPLGQNVAASTEVDADRAKLCLQETGFTARLAQMPNGIDTYLKKDFEPTGVDISGGEAQKIALARALYKQAPFVVLDEPTAALDPIAEYEVYTNIDRMAHGKTAIFISHRLSSCRFCDDIAVFHKGRLVQRGTHEALLEDPDGMYAALWHAQAQYYTDEDAG